MQSVMPARFGGGGRGCCRQSQGQEGERAGERGGGGIAPRCQHGCLFSVGGESGVEHEGGGCEDELANGTAY